MPLRRPQGLSAAGELRFAPNVLWRQLDYRTPLPCSSRERRNGVRPNYKDHDASRLRRSPRNARTPGYLDGITPDARSALTAIFLSAVAPQPPLPSSYEQGKLWSAARRSFRDAALAHL